jgi:hypothetical protein
MPYLNKKGEWCAGVGGTQASWGVATGVGNVIWEPAGGTHWLDDDTIIAQHCPSGCFLKTYNVRTGVETVVANQGASFLSAGGGVWVAWLGGVGVYSSDPPGWSSLTAGAPTVGPDGAFTLKRDYQSYGPWDVHEPDGEDWVLTENDAAMVQLLGKKRASWTEAEPHTTEGVPTPNPGTRPYWWLRMLETPKGWYVLYQESTAGKLVLHPVLSKRGWVVASGQDTFTPDMCLMPDGQIRVVWAWHQAEVPGSVVVRDIDVSKEGPDEVGGEPPADTGGGGVDDSGIVIAGTRTLSSKSTFGVAGAAEEIVSLPIEIFPAYPAESGHGRIVHPTLGAFDYEVKPDEWVNIDADAIIPPVWSSSRTLTSAANVLWAGVLRDVVVEERWKAVGGLAMPVTQFRMLLAIWTTPVDPDVGYVQWYPNYITGVGFKVLPVNLSAGGQGIALDDVTNYKDDEGEPIGWVTSPVTLTLKLVERL